MVEDDSAIADAVLYCLRRDGMHAEVAETLAAARCATEGALPDVVILDLGLPDGSGFSLIPELRRSASCPRPSIVCARGDRSGT